MNQKLVAITMGDPAGIGPEIIVAAWQRLPEASRRRCFVVGRSEILKRASRDLGLSIPVQTIMQLPESFDDDSISCLEVGDTKSDSIEIGKCSATAGDVAFQSIIQATQLAIDGRISAMVTAPINKMALRMAGHEFPGHTELIAELCGVQFVAMMLYLSRGYVPSSTVGLGVAHATLHQALRSAIDSLNTDTILKTSQLTYEFFKRRLLAGGFQRPPHVAVAALNPHGGEAGLFGSEEINVIQPAVNMGIQLGLALNGPLPCDTLMARAVNGEFDAVVAMYHDQGHIAFKLLNMHRAVNVTLGLPIVRTSPAHGTAFELAGSGKADFGGLLEALRLADALASEKEVH
ncbi:MAG TPA: 4-hydroxythreonine-4-phosphate dehydrogenase PdxA [Pirellulaceae bacterium]|nr:4-hydroxythreonine-4-phosphate dehydrogenase PdxA [Pirellulaceae bacterium]HMO92842.1 4-hydroxythreonine-4-phosphate dehydrogenase PdxA [Pirellulaceae bacterium]HMP69416.1 4-hydroxythreonine-4-phosphate dehydrogenase PdxA [Pirellulaceae bacterium]